MSAQVTSAAAQGAKSAGKRSGRSEWRTPRVIAGRVIPGLGCVGCRVTSSTGPTFCTSDYARRVGRVKGNVGSSGLTAEKSPRRGEAAWAVVLGVGAKGRETFPTSNPIVPAG